MNKRQLGIIIGMIGLLVIVGIIVLANSGPHYFKIPIFQIIFEGLKIAAVIIYELSKMIIIGIWHATTKSWLSGLITLGVMVVGILLFIYQRIRE